VEVLLRKGAAPAIIFTSPFTRCQQTAHLMQQVVERTLNRKVPVEVDVALSRYFFESEKMDPNISPSTANYRVPIYENKSELKKRVHKHLTKVREKHRHQVVWVITHGIVKYTMLKLAEQSAKKYYDFLETSAFTL
jgi:broad specificity phosphatase PhoE